MNLRRTARVHQAGVTSEDYWEFHPGEKVMTSDGVPGVVTAVEDGPFPQTELYIVDLDDDLGGGHYSVSQLQSLGSKEARVASEDYPELGDILEERLPLAHSEKMSGKVAKVWVMVGDEKITVYENEPPVGEAGLTYEIGELITRGNPEYAVTLFAWNENGIASEVWQAEGYQSEQEARGHVRSEVQKYFQTWASLQVEAGYVVKDDGGYVVAGPFESRARAEEELAFFQEDEPEYNYTIEREASSQKEAGFWDRVLEPTFDEVNRLQSPQHRYNPQTGEMASYDWCRFRRNRRCFYPKRLNEQATAQVGYAVYIPEDRGFCPRESWDDQRACPAPSEPGPNATDARPLADATIPWEQGGQRYDEYGRPIDPRRGTLVQIQSAAGDTRVDQTVEEISLPDAPPGDFAEDLMEVIEDHRDRKRRDQGGNPYDEDNPYMSSLTVELIEGEFPFHLTAKWEDVQEKATRIRRDGHVRVISASPQFLVGEVRGDTNIYQATLHRELGTERVALWECGCAWAAYSWGRSGRWKKYEGRMCSHALALQYEGQSRGWGSGEVTEDRSKPSWMSDPSITVKQPGDYKKPEIGQWMVGKHARLDWSASLAEKVADWMEKKSAYYEGAGWEGLPIPSVTQVLNEILGRDTYWFHDGDTKPGDAAIVLQVQEIVRSGMSPEALRQQAKELRQIDAKEAEFEGEPTWAEVSVDGSLREAPMVAMVRGMTFDGDHPADIINVFTAMGVNPSLVAEAMAAFDVKYRGRVHKAYDVDPYGHTVTLDTGEAVPTSEVEHPNYDPRRGLASKTALNWDRAVELNNQIAEKIGWGIFEQGMDHPDLEYLASQGGMVSWSNKKVGNGTPSNCHVDARRIAGRTSGSVLYTGFAFADDTWLPHSWVMAGNTLIDPWFSDFTHYWGAPDPHQPTSASKTALWASELVESVVSDGVMICLRPPDEILEPIHIEDGEDWNNLHITLAYLGKTDDVDQGVLNAAVEEWAGRWPELAGELSGYGHFENGRDEVLVVLVDMPGLERARDDLVDVLAEHGITLGGDDHGFTPHLTLQYDPDSIPDSLPEEAKAEFTISDVFAVHGDDWHNVLLGSGVEATLDEILGSVQHEATHRVVDLSKHHWLTEDGRVGAMSAPAWGIVNEEGLLVTRVGEDQPSVWSRRGIVENDILPAVDSFPNHYFGLRLLTNGGAEAELKDEPEPALPYTTGDEEEEEEVDGPIDASQFMGEETDVADDPDIEPPPAIVEEDPDLAMANGEVEEEEEVEKEGMDSRAWLMKDSGNHSDSDIAQAAKEHLAKLSLKDFTAEEQQQLISEGEGVRANNLDRLDISGTHYEALQEAYDLLEEDENDETWLM